MKIVEIDGYSNVPEMLEMEGGCYLMEDSIWQLNLETGDLIQCLSDFGTMCYYVLLVEPADDQRVGHGLNLCWIESVEYGLDTVH